MVVDITFDHFSAEVAYDTLTLISSIVVQYVQFEQEPIDVESVWVSSPVQVNGCARTFAMPLAKFLVLLLLPRTL